MKRGLLFLLISAVAAVLAYGNDYKELTTSRRYENVFMNRCFYDDRLVGYEFFFEVEDVNDSITLRKEINFTIVVDCYRKNVRTVPVGRFSLGGKDSVSVNAIDYYESRISYLEGDAARYESQDSDGRFVAFSVLDVQINKCKLGRYEVLVDYVTAEGDTANCRYFGKLGFAKMGGKSVYEFEQPDKGVMNLELTDAELNIYEATGYGSRRGVLRLGCGEIEIILEVYVPCGEVYGRYVMRYSKDPFGMLRSRGGFFYRGSYYMTDQVSIEDKLDGLFYYPVSGFLEISGDKVVFDFECHNGGILRGVYRGKCEIR